MHPPTGRGRGRPTAAAGPLLTRQRLLDAAAERLSHGYAALSMRGLARDLGVSLATVQHHVPTKDALFRAVVDEVVVPRLSQDRRGAELLAAAAEQFDATARDVAVREQLGRRAQALAIHGGVVASALDDTGPGAQGRRAYVISAIEADRLAAVGALRAMGERGAIRPVSPALWTALSLAVVPALHRSAGGLRDAGLPAADAETLVDEFVDVLVNGLLPRAAAPPDADVQRWRDAGQR